MGNFLSKRWFLLTLAAGCLLAWLWPAAIAWTHWISPRLTMPLALFLSAWTMDGRSLLDAVRRPWPALWAVAISYVAIPLLGWAAGLVLPTEFRLGLLVCVSAPCTLASGVLWTRMANGNEADALLSTFISTSLSFLSTTTLLALMTGEQIELDYPAMMVDLALTLVAPLILGQLIRAVPFLARFATAQKTKLSVVARLIVLLIMIRTAYAVAEKLNGEATQIGLGVIALTAFACIGTHLLGLGLGLWSARRLGMDAASQIAVAFSGSQKTLPVSLVVLQLHFPKYPLAVVPLLFYHAGQLIVDTFIADRWAEAHPDRAPSPN